MAAKQWATHGVQRCSRRPRFGPLRRAECTKETNTMRQMALVAFPASPELYNHSRALAASGGAP
ncbi:hypothetical protein NKDENANG_01033 [Candidatus Entotheonellaceae bacterium PAL068K]